jgi:RNA polymerase sigma factor (sigma-70 family)
MHLTDQEMTVALRHYEGLIRSTALLVVSQLGSRAEPGDDLEDVMQLLRVKVWQALRWFKPDRMPRKANEDAVQTRDRFVFMCLMNTKKDIAKRKRTAVLLIEDQAPARGGEHEDGPRDAFEARYLAESDEEIVRTPPLVPNTLTGFERRVLVLLYGDYKQVEIARRLGASEREVSGAVRALRAKLADWQPAGVAPAAAIAIAG